MPYRIVDSERVSDYGVIYIHQDIVFITEVEPSMRDSDQASAAFGWDALEEIPSENIRILDPDWDTIPF